MGPSRRLFFWSGRLALPPDSDCAAVSPQSLDALPMGEKRFTGPIPGARLTLRYAAIRERAVASCAKSG